MYRHSAVICREAVLQAFCASVVFGAARLLSAALFGFTVQIYSIAPA